MPRPDLEAIAERVVKSVDGECVPIAQMQDDLMDTLSWVATQYRALENMIRRNSGFLDADFLQRQIERAERELKIEDQMFKEDKDGGNSP